MIYNWSNMIFICSEICDSVFWASSKIVSVIVTVIIIIIIIITRSTQRAQTSLAEADHYSHIVHCKNVEPWL